MKHASAFAYKRGIRLLLYTAVWVLSTVFLKKIYFLTGSDKFRSEGGNEYKNERYLYCTVLKIMLK